MAIDPRSGLMENHFDISFLSFNSIVYPFRTIPAR